MGLCCLGALRGLCGFCVRVELGGFMACGVFAFLFLSLPLFLFLLPCLLFFFALVVFACPFALSLCFLFPFRYMRKKKGRNSLRPLLFCCELV